MQTSVFDAWAAYDKEAVGVYWPASGFRRPAKEVRLNIIPFRRLQLPVL